MDGGVRYVLRDVCLKSARIIAMQEIAGSRFVPRSAALYLREADGLTATGILSVGQNEAADDVLATWAPAVAEAGKFSQQGLLDGRAVQPGEVLQVRIVTPYVASGNVHGDLDVFGFHE